MSRRFWAAKSQSWRHEQDSRDRGLGDRAGLAVSVAVAAEKQPGAGASVPRGRCCRDGSMMALSAGWMMAIGLGARV
jgi:hypothetical protein